MSYFRAVLVLAVMPGSAFAHKMEMTATVGHPDPGIVRVEAAYEFGDPAEAAVVKLHSAAGAEVAHGTTDAAGVCVLPRPPAGEYLITVDDGGGHRETLWISVPMSPAEIVAAESAKRNRWAMSAVGLGVIAGLTVGGRRLARKPPISTK
ncbi:MAG: carboxypeptidase-like regulatory domain-containing protein [Fimbriiglobus sp.]